MGMASGVDYAGKDVGRKCGEPEVGMELPRLQALRDQEPSTNLQFDRGLSHERFDQPEDSYYVGT